MLDDLLCPDPLGATVGAVVDAVLRVPVKGDVVPERDVHPVVGHRVKLPVDGAPGAALLVGPGLSPAGPELGGGVFFGKIFQFGLTGNAAGAGDKVKLVVAGNGQDIGVGCAVGRFHLAQPVRLGFVCGHDTLSLSVLVVDEPNVGSVLVKVHVAFFACLKVCLFSSASST